MYTLYQALSHLSCTGEEREARRGVERLSEEAPAVELRAAEETAREVGEAAALDAKAREGGYDGRSPLDGLRTHRTPRAATHACSSRASAACRCSRAAARR